MAIWQIFKWRNKSIFEEGFNLKRDPVLMIFYKTDEVIKAGRETFSQKED